MYRYAAHDTLKFPELSRERRKQILASEHDLRTDDANLLLYEEVIISEINCRPEFMLIIWRTDR